MNNKEPDNRFQKRANFSNGYRRRWQLKAESAKQMLSVMDSIAHPNDSAKGFDCVVICDAGIDPQKHDPAITSIVIFADKVVVSSRPLSFQDRKAIKISATTMPHINELEQYAIENGLSIAATQGCAAKEMATLVITDSEKAMEALGKSPITNRQTVIRHVSNDINSQDHRMLHTLADELCRFSRRANGPENDVIFDRKALEETIIKQSQITQL